MDFGHLIDIASKLNVPGLAARGIKIAKDTVEFASLVKTNAARGAVVLADGDRDMLDAIHAEALAAADALDAKLAAAGKR